MSIEIDGFYYKSKNRRPFFALKDIRGDIEPKEIYLCVKGGLKNVYPSGMSYIGYYAYELNMGMQATKKVNILDEIKDYDIEDLGTIEEQEIFWKAWISSLRK